MREWRSLTCARVCSTTAPLGVHMMTKYLITWWGERREERGGTRVIKMEASSVWIDAEK